MPTTLAVFKVQWPAHEYEYSCEESFIVPPIVDVLPEVYNSSRKLSDTIKENGKALNLFIWFVCLLV